MKRLKLKAEPDWSNLRRGSDLPWYWDDGDKDFNTFGQSINGVPVCLVTLVQMRISLSGWRSAQVVPRMADHGWPRDLIYRRHAP